MCEGERAIFCLYVFACYLVCGWAFTFMGVYMSVYACVCVCVCVSD